MNLTGGGFRLENRLPHYVVDTGPPCFDLPDHKI